MRTLEEILKKHGVTFGDLIKMGIVSKSAAESWRCGRRKPKTLTLLGLDKALEDRAIESRR